MISEYHAALQAYSRAVNALQGCSGPQFDEAYLQAEQARLECEKCRIALEDHERQS